MSQRTQEVYNERLKAPPKETVRGRTTKKNSPPQSKPNQSTKSTTGGRLELKNNLDQAQKLQTKECLSP